MVSLYTFALEEYRNGNYTTAEAVSDVVMSPEFHTDEFLTQMKRRLYTKDNTHYKQWEHLGETQENWYFVDGTMRKYVNGHRTVIKQSLFIMSQKNAKLAQIHDLQNIISDATLTKQDLVWIIQGLRNLDRSEFSQREYNDHEDLINYFVKLTYKR